MKGLTVELMLNSGSVSGPHALLSEQVSASLSNVLASGSISVGLLSLLKKVFFASVEPGVKETLLSLNVRPDGLSVSITCLTTDIPDNEQDSSHIFASFVGIFNHFFIEVTCIKADDCLSDVESADMFTFPWESFHCCLKE